MKKTNVTGKASASDMSVTPLDVGFDLRVHSLPVVLPDGVSSVAYEANGNICRVEGTRAEIAETLKTAGYSIAEGDQ